jgi:hypothetical protein
MTILPEGFGGQKRPNGFFGLILLILWDLSYWPVALAIAMSHYIIDGLKLSFQTEKNRSYWFAADQLAHLAVLFTVWFYYWNETPFYTISDEFWVILTGTIFLTYPSSYIMMNVMSRWTTGIELDNEGSLNNAGKFIGILERLFVYLAIITGHLQVIGFLLAAKSIFRFGDLTRSKDRKLTEYILIGTLLSFLIAIFAGLITVQILN